MKLSLKQPWANDTFLEIPWNTLERWLWLNVGQYWTIMDNKWQNRAITMIPKSSSDYNVHNYAKSGNIEKYLRLLETYEKSVNIDKCWQYHRLSDRIEVTIFWIISNQQPNILYFLTVQNCSISGTIGQYLT